MELFYLHTFLFFSFLFLSFYFYTSSKKPIRKGFKYYPIVGLLPDFIKNRYRFLDWTTEAIKSCPTNTAPFVRPAKVRGILTANPLNVEYILKNNFDNYPKGDRFLTVLGDFLGQGIFNSDGELWRVQRKTASYEFNTKSLRKFVVDSISSEISSRLIPILTTASLKEQVLDLQDILERFAFDNICKVAFNVDPGCLDGDGAGHSEFMSAFENAATLSSERFRSAFLFIWKIKRFFNIGSEHVLRKSIATVHAFANEIIRSRMESKTQNTDEDLLSRFIGNDNHSLDFLRDIVISFILAGRDTTSSALTSFFWLLSSRPNLLIPKLA